MPLNWFYRVTQFVGAFNEKNEAIEHFLHAEDFKVGDLPAMRTAAIGYHQQRLADVPKSFFHDFVSTDNYVEGVPHAKHSIDIALVSENSESGNEEEHIIFGEDNDTNAGGWETECLLYMQQGLDMPPMLITK